MTMNPMYIRVAANVFDSYSTITDIYSVTFKNEVPMINAEENIISFVNNYKNINDGIRRMFNPMDGSEGTSEFGQSINVISYNTKACGNINDTTTYPITYDDLYYTYIYTKNASSYERVQTANVTSIRGISLSEERAYPSYNRIDTGRKIPVYDNVENLTPVWTSPNSAYSGNYLYNTFDVVDDAYGNGHYIMNFLNTMDNRYPMIEQFQTIGGENGYSGIKIISNTNAIAGDGVTSPTTFDCVYTLPVPIKLKTVAWGSRYDDLYFENEPDYPSFARIYGIDDNGANVEIGNWNNSNPDRAISYPGIAAFSRDGFIVECTSDQLFTNFRIQLHNYQLFNSELKSRKIDSKFIILYGQEYVY